MSKPTLNLLFIDEEQIYAESLVNQLSAYFDEVNLGFWDEKSELIKALRQEWDVLVFSRAYDMAFTDVIGILQEMDVNIPVIELLHTDAKDIAVGAPSVIDGNIIKSLYKGQDDLIVTSICLQAAYVAAKRKSQELKNILKEAEHRASILIKNSKSAVAYIEQGVHIFANDPYLELFGYQNLEDVIGVPVVDLISGGDNVKGFKQFLRKFDKGDRSQVEFAFESKRTDDSTFSSKLQLAAATYEGEPVTQIIIQPDTNGNSAEIAKKLAEAERLDVLTGLPNRIAFMQELDNVRNDALGGNGNSALLFVRIDNIGQINSSASIAGVDATIKTLGYLLAEQFADSFVSRFSDAHFAVLVSGKSKDTILKDAEQLRERTEQQLIEVGNRTVTTTVSVGVVMIDSNAPDSETILGRANQTIAEIHQGDEGGNQVALFDISRHAGSDDTALAEYLANALTDNRFVIRYQPAYDITNDNSDLFEVYVTLPMADGTDLTYDKFAGIAKAHNLLDKIDRWVLINAAKALASIKKDHPNANLLIGLSSSSLTLANNQLVKIMAQLIKALGGHAPLTLQFHEQDLVDYLAVAKRQFMALSDLGCPVGIQAFGTTTKSAELLDYLAPDMVRLASSYSKDLDRPANLETTQALVNKANDKSVSVLIPHINSAPSMSSAWAMGVRYVQGDYLQPATDQIVYAS